MFVKSDKELLLKIHAVELAGLEDGLYRNQIANFLHNIKKSASGCWVWRGRITSGGYGQMAMFGRRLWAHRLSYLLHVGDISKSLMVLHSCDNRCCVNPDHLRLGTALDNTQDMMQRGRANKRALKGSENPRSKITEKDVIKIRKLGATGIAHYKLAKKFNISRSSISTIIRKESWKHT